MKLYKTISLKKKKNKMKEINMRKVIGLITVVSLVMIFCLSSYAAGTEIEKRVLKLGSNSPPTSIVPRAAFAFNEVLSEISGGKLTINIITDSALGSTPQHYSQLSQGTLDMYVTGYDTAAAVPGGSDFTIFNVPFLFDNYDHFWRFINSDTFAGMCQKVLEQSDIFYFGNASMVFPRGLNTRKPIYTVDDVIGLKIRVPEVQTFISVWKGLGASPVIMPFVDLYSAIESGIVDAQENSAVNSMPTGMFEVLKYYQEIEYILGGNVFWMSNKTWESLNETQQQWMLESLEISRAKYNKILKDEKAQVDKRAHEEYGVVYVDVDVQSFRDKAAEITENELLGDVVNAEIYEDVISLRSNVN